MREIVTIQVGDFANFIGSHFWNVQDELLGLASDPESDPIFRNQNLDMDVLYRSGETQQGVSTYTPRLVSVNFKGSLGSMSSRGTLYNEGSSSRSDSSKTWFGDVDTKRSEPRKKNLFLQSLYEEEVKVGKEKATKIEDKDIVGCLDEEVECWTDFSKSHYHPQSLYELSGLWTDSQDFNNYGIGKDVFSEASRGEEICDRLRFFVEECDHIQGIKFLVDDSGGFSAVAADFLETIADDYTNIPVLLYSVRTPMSQMNPSSSKKTVSNKLHDAISFSRLSSYCKLFTPIGLPYLSGSKASKFLNLGDEKPYRSSAVYAAALHSSTIPFRMQPSSSSSSSDSSEVSNAMDVNTLVQLLTGRGRQNMVAILDSAMPAPTLAGKQLENTLLTDLQSLTPEVTEDVEDEQAIELMCILGALRSEDKEASVSEVTNAVDACYEQRKKTKPLFCNLSVSRCPLPVPLPFPSIFGNLVGRKGEILSSPVVSESLDRGSLDVHSLPVAARWRSSSAVLPFLESRMGNLEKLGIQWGAMGSDVVRAWGFGREELQEMRENLSKMVSELSPQFLISSDSE
uniref:Protein misato-like protein 1 n=1 Tax=Noccaea caerulescens TaxID=107243 RepID=A0A1J3I6Z5_NOCCA